MRTLARAATAVRLSSVAAARDMRSSELVRIRDGRHPRNRRKLFDAALIREVRSISPFSRLAILALTRMSSIGVDPGILMQ
jgi:hypothetical protein